MAALRLYSIENWGVDDDFSTMDNVKLKQYSYLVPRNTWIYSGGKEGPYR